MSQAPQLGVCYDRSFPAAAIGDFAQRVEAAGLDSLYVIEDSFFDAGVPLAAAALARTTEVEVGLGVMPSVTRTAGLMAMSISTLANLSPGRFVAGIGHGVASWMEQMGIRPESPLTALEEVLGTVRQLLAGGEVTHQGRYVHLDQVRLNDPPEIGPPLLAGVQGPRSLGVAGTLADGIILAEGVGANYITWALQQAARTPDDFRVVTYTFCVVDDSPERARAAIAPLIADAVRHNTTAMQQLSCFAGLSERVRTGGVDALMDMPTQWWSEIGAIGTLDDATAHVQQLVEAGAHTVCLFPGPRLELGHRAIEIAAELKTRLAVG